MTQKRSKVAKKKTRLTTEQKAENALKRIQENEIKLIFKNLGFTRVANIDGKNITYNERSSEMDDIFVCENIILIVEYTIQQKPGSHIKNKILFYDKINANHKNFIKFLRTEPKLDSFRKYYDEKIEAKYSINQLQLRILYCSRFSVAQEHKNVAESVHFFDYNLVQYFKFLSKAIKRSGRYEFLEFLGLNYDEFGDNILRSDRSQSNKYLGHILPEDKSSFKEGYKIVSFYIDAESLLSRSFVLRNEGWRKKENVEHYQRMLDSKKISGMRKYLSEKKRVFINNLIATISETKIKLLDEKGSELKIDSEGQFIDSSQFKVTPAQIEINDERNIIGLIDGQHRTYAYHEGDDQYEEKIKALRKVQNLLVTGIIFPAEEKIETRLKFQANLFLEINSNQNTVKTTLKQELELMINPFSAVSVGKRILIKLNESGPFEDLIELYSFEKGKLKTSSIVSFGLKPLIKLDENTADSLFKVWNNSNKLLLTKKESEEYQLLEEYIRFSTTEIREMFIAVKRALNPTQWSLYSYSTPDGLLNVNFFNSFLNVLRLLIESGKLADNKAYFTQVDGKEFRKFPFKNYGSSQYRKMGQDIYDLYFK